MTGRAAELGAQYATVEEILEQPSPLPQRLQQLCRHLCHHVAHYATICLYAALHDRPGQLTLVAAAGRRPYPSTVIYGEGLLGRAADAGVYANRRRLPRAGAAILISERLLGARASCPLEHTGGPSAHLRASRPLEHLWAFGPPVGIPPA